MKAKNSRYSDSVELYQSGMSVGDCAKHYSITRQAMWKILKRRGAAFRPKPTRERNHFFRGGVAASKRAQRLVEAAARNKVLQPQPCEVCGNVAVAHHDDYNHPLRVRWLCRPHHHDWHKANKAIPLTGELPRLSDFEIRSMGGKASAEKLTAKQRQERARRSLAARRGREA